MINEHMIQIILFVFNPAALNLEIFFELRIFLMLYVHVCMIQIKSFYLCCGIFQNILSASGLPTAMEAKEIVSAAFPMKQKVRLNSISIKLKYKPQKSRTVAFQMILQLNN